MHRGRRVHRGRPTERRNDPNGSRTGRRVHFLARLEGFRRFTLGLVLVLVLGLVLVGLGAAWATPSEALLFLAIGIGIVETLESGVVIAVWRRGRGRAAPPLA